MKLPEAESEAELLELEVVKAMDLFFLRKLGGLDQRKPELGLELLELEPELPEPELPKIAERHPAANNYPCQNQ